MRNVFLFFVAMGLVCSGWFLTGFLVLWCSVSMSVDE